MIVALSRFSVNNADQSEARAAFESRPYGVESAPGFLGLEVFQSGPTFYVLTRWSDESAFRSWHDGPGPAHGAAQTWIAAGLKLDPAQTELCVATRLDAATSAGAEGNLLSDGLIPLGRMIRESSSIHILILDAAGRITYASRAFGKAVGQDPMGMALGALLTAGSAEALRCRMASASTERFLLQLEPRQEERQSLQAFLQPHGAGHIVVAEPPWDDHRAVQEHLLALNSELSVLSRENARQAIALEAAHRQLRDAHWHLKKMSDVLPMCMSCRSVRTEDGQWEDVSSFLVKHSDFISHGYCTRCAEKLEAELVLPAKG